MRTREDIVTLLNEPLSTLHPDEIKAIEKMAVTDPEIAVLLTQSRALGSLQETTVFGEAVGDDAAFLAKLRQKIDHAEARVAKRPVFLPVRRLALAASLCVVVLVVVLGVGQRRLSPQLAATSSSAQNLADALTVPVSMSLDSLSDEISDADSLAGYLGVADLADAWTEDSDTVSPIPDQLLTMNTKDLEDILHELEQTNFF